MDVSKREGFPSVFRAIEREPGGVAIVLSPNFDARESLIEQVEEIVSDAAHPMRETCVEGAIANPARMVLLIPEDERDVVVDLDASRECILGQTSRSQPIVLFLLRDGDGVRALAKEAPSLRSWIGGIDVDPDKLAEIDVAKERVVFEVEHGMTVDVWLAKWRADELPLTASNYHALHRATLLEDLD